MAVRVSIITPSYNQAAFLEATIRSVLEQDYLDVEYILVDGGSTDGSLEIIQKYATRLAGWVSEPDRGQTDAINKGFARASGDILAWINSDDTYQPGAVSEAVAYLQAHPDVGMVYGDANLIDENGSVLGRFPAQQTDYRALAAGIGAYPAAGQLFPRQLVAPGGTPGQFVLLCHGLRSLGAAGEDQPFGLLSPAVGKLPPARTGEDDGQRRPLLSGDAARLPAGGWQTVGAVSAQSLAAPADLRLAAGPIAHLVAQSRVGGVFCSVTSPVTTRSGRN